MSPSFGTAQGSKKKGNIVLTCCCGCGAQFERRKSSLNASGLHYLSVQHAGAHRARVYLEDMCGPWLGLALEYLDACARQQCKHLSTIRVSICPLFLFLCEKEITDLERVTPKTITEFLDWADEVDYGNAAHNISNLTGFFKWACLHGYRRSDSPVSPKFHGKKRPRYEPRPYSTDEMKLIWKFAEERGTAQVRAALALGEESGLRSGELCRLRVQDIDLDGLWVFVRLPNKTSTERRAKFTDRAARYIATWLTERDDGCGHDLLFYNKLGHPMRPETLHAEFCRTFCRIHAGKVIHGEGLERWSTHRLRHTMASKLASGGAPVATIMGAGGWSSFSSMLIYTKTDSEQARRGYHEAMARAYEREKTSSRPESLSFDAFLAAYGNTQA